MCVGNVFPAPGLGLSGLITVPDRLRTAKNHPRLSTNFLSCPTGRNRRSVARRMIRQTHSPPATMVSPVSRADRLHEGMCVAAGTISMANGLCAMGRREPIACTCSIAVPAAYPTKLSPRRPRPRSVQRSAQRPAFSCPGRADSRWNQPPLGLSPLLRFPLYSPLLSSRRELHSSPYAPSLCSPRFARRAWASPYAERRELMGRCERLLGDQV